MSSSHPLTTDFTLQLRDGRTVGIATVGTSDGFPIFHCHGSTSSRLEVNLFAVAAVAQGVQLICLDRPGLGRSDARPGYHLLDWPDDVAEVADQLGIERFAVEGASAGGPYAMACAYKIPHRLTACGLIGTVSPPHLMRKAGPGWMRAMWWMGAHLPSLFQFYLRIVMPDAAPDVAAIEKRLLRSSAHLSEADQKLFHTPEMREGFAQSLAESRKLGAKGNRDEAAMLIQPWGFKVEEITGTKIFVWHGEPDRVMSVAPARLLAQTLPHCTATFYPDEGHFSILVNHAREIWKALSN